MGWQDRSYYRDSGRGGFFGNTMSLMSYSAPFGQWFGVPVRLHIWLLLFMGLSYLRATSSAQLVLITAHNALLIIALLCHEFGHLFFARWVGGTHDEFLLWPPGGLIHPKPPPYPGATFLTHAGGIAANLLLCLACLGVLNVMKRVPTEKLWNPVSMLLGDPANPSNGYPVSLFVQIFFQINMGLVLINLLPFYWFDGGYLLQSILWPWTGLFRAINVTCIIGMIIAVPMCLLMLVSASLFGMIYWGMLFYDSYRRRQELHASGTGEFDAAIAHSASLRDDDGGPARRKTARWPTRSAAQRAAGIAAAERKEQEQIDAILDKVHKQGMQSLTWLEKRALHKATERQRERGGAPRR